MWIIENALIQQNNRGLFFKDKQGNVIYLETLQDGIHIGEGETLTLRGLLRISQYQSVLLITEVI